MTIFTHIWVSCYETHKFLQVDGGQRDPREMGRHISNTHNLYKNMVLICKVNRN